MNFREENNKKIKVVPDDLEITINDFKVIKDDFEMTLNGLKVL